MKKKFLFGIAAGLFAVASVMSFNMSNANGIGNVSLDDIAIMAHAQNEVSGEDNTGKIVSGYHPTSGTICDAEGGQCDVSAQDPNERK